jgi:hypothetical protein
MGWVSHLLQGLIIVLGGIVMILVSYMSVTENLSTNVSKNFGMICLALLVAILGLMMLALGGHYVLSRPNRYTFDRKTGDLTVLTRSVFRKKIEHYLLSDIKTVELVTRVPTAEELASFVVNLIIQVKNDKGYLTEYHLNISRSGSFNRQCHKAEMVAAFLDLPIRKRME